MPPHSEQPRSQPQPQPQPQLQLRQQHRDLSDCSDIDGLNRLFQAQLLVSQVPQSVWGVLLSLSPEDYPTTLLERSSTRRQAPPSSASPKQQECSASFGYYIGRHKSCNIKIKIPHISNRHCLIYRVDSEDCDDPEGLLGSRVYLEDTSTNGTFVNGTRVKKNAPIELQDGDEIQLARYQPEKGMDYFSDRFYVFQNLDVHRREPCLFKQSYLLADRLGAGAFAEVRMAINRVTGARYAAKIINRNRMPQLEKRKKLDENFLVETSILSRVRHPSIVQVHGVFKERDSLYLVLDLATDGELFDEIVRRELLSEDDARRVLLQLLLAIRHLNRLGIVHRDIKLENILLADRDALRIKLADFGLAKLVGEQTFMKTVCGTPMYVAPEVLTVKQMGMYDKQVDMWSIGVVLYICLCGFPPFSDELAPPCMRDQILNGVYSFPSPYWDTVSDEALNLVNCMLQVDPRNRITVEEALEHPWLRASRVGHMWVVDGVADFAVDDPDALEDSQRTQSVTVESSQCQLSQPGSQAYSGAAGQPTFLQSPVASRPKLALTLPPSSPPVAAAISDSEAQQLRRQYYSPDEPTAAISSGRNNNDNNSATNGQYGYSAGGSEGNAEDNALLAKRKRKDPSFMRSQSDLSQLVSPKRSMHFNQHARADEPMLNHMPDSGPLAMFEMSPEMSRHTSSTNEPHKCPSPNKRIVMNFPKPLPLPTAAQQQQQDVLMHPAMPVGRSVANKPCSREMSGVSEDVVMSRQSSANGHQALPAFFDLCGKRV
ncbi:serine/threonine protein kinase [Coemansia sp. Benny D115]|nr:serine/threonine protein kinase [Coemansia sp. Benny D115]